MPSCFASRDPADPPNALVICWSEALNRHVRREYRCTVFGRRSVNICCPQSSLSQKNRRTRSSIRIESLPKADHSTFACNGCECAVTLAGILGNG